MTTRMNVAEVAPDAYSAIMGLEKYARKHVDPHAVPPRELPRVDGEQLRVLHRHARPRCAHGRRVERPGCSHLTAWQRDGALHGT